MRLWLLAMVAVLAAVASSQIGHQPVVSANPPDADAVAQRVVELTNIARVSQGLAPLRLQANLRDAAMWLAQDLGDYRYFSHTDRLGRDFVTRLTAFGYSNWTAMGENIAAGQRTPEEAVSAWMNSPSHRANILSTNYREIGGGYGLSSGSPYGYYWAQEFGARSGVYPLVIDNEAAQTTNPTVSLYIHGGGWAQQMRLSNDGQSWTAWGSYQATRSWSLAPGSGVRAVYVQLSNGSTTLTASDSIEMIGTSIPAATLSHHVFLPLAVRN